MSIVIHLKKNSAPTTQKRIDLTIDEEKDEIGYIDFTNSYTGLL